MKINGRCIARNHHKIGARFRLHTALARAGSGPSLTVLVSRPLEGSQQSPEKKVERHLPEIFDMPLGLQESRVGKYSRPHAGAFRQPRIVIEQLRQYASVVWRRQRIHCGFVSDSVPLRYSQ